MVVSVKEVNNGTNTVHLTFDEGLMPRTDTAATFKSVFYEKNGHVHTNHSSELKATVNTSSSAYHVNVNPVVDLPASVVAK